MNPGNGCCRALLLLCAMCLCGAGEDEGRVSSAVEDSRAAGEASVAALVRQLDAPTRHQAIRKLGEHATPQARQVLLETALGRRGSAFQEWAATCYVKSLTDRRDARHLLASDKREIVSAGLLALRGEVIDEVILSDLSRSSKKLQRATPFVLNSLRPNNAAWHYDSPQTRRYQTMCTPTAFARVN
ncbi:MAG: hypothetical protein FJ387_27695 [Verrucomicrobia bacterium]|nr:hypothetical protein [Verrucomicrobiota bacterium]